MYNEEISFLSADQALRIMQDEVSLVLPSIKHTMVDSERGTSEYNLVLKDMVSGQEYMHPESVTSLDNWHCLFVDCPLLQGVDFVSHAFPDLLLLSPPSHDVAVLARTFTIRSRTFKLTVTRAPLSPQSPVTFYALSTADLPIHYTAFEAKFPTSAKRKACLRQYAILALLSSKGLDAVPLAKGIPIINDEFMIQQLTLEHSTNLFHGVGTKSYQASGWFEMQERETTAASASLPLLLKHLYFLQFTLGGKAIEYHIKAPNKYAYMVRLRDVGGLEIYYQVNMNASLVAMQNAFAQSSLTPRPPPYAPRKTASSSSSSILQQKFLIKTIQDQQNELRAIFQDTDSKEISLESMEEEPYVSYMKFTGLDILLREISGEALFRNRMADKQSAKKVLEALLTVYAQKKAPTTASVSQEECLKTMCMVLMGAVGDMWDNLNHATGGEEEDDEDDTKKPAALIKLLSKTLGDAHYLRIKDAALLPVLVRSCLGSDPYEWWERFVAICDIQGVDRNKLNVEDEEKSAYFCASLLYHPERYSTLFPSSLLLPSSNQPAAVPVDKDQWISLVDSASSMDKDLGNMKEASEDLLGGKKESIQNKILSDKGARRLYYVRAVAFLMLLGRGEDIPRLKVY